MNDARRSRIDELLDVLVDAVLERLEARRKTRSIAPEPPVDASTLPFVVPWPDAASKPISEPEPVTDLASELESEPEPEFVPALFAQPTTHAVALMARLALGIFVLVVLINIPLNGQGIALARSIPSSASLVIRDGLIVKETGGPKIWIYRNGAFHWITSLEVFETLGYDWQDVHEVNDGFLEPFVEGRPVYLLLTCEDIPHYYRLEDGRKRWIVDVPTFTAEGYVWQDLTNVSCDYLHDLPDGESIPPGHGLPPAPLP